MTLVERLTHLWHRFSRYWFSLDLDIPTDRPRGGKAEW
jgi:hypothetical protein